MSLYRCAACGSPNVVTDTQAGGIKYNYIKGVVGTVALGVGGAAAGITSEVQKVYKCPDCGITLTYAMPQEMKNLVDIGVMSSEARKDLKFLGVPVSWEFIRAKYKNVEEGTGDEEIAERITKQEVIRKQIEIDMSEEAQGQRNALRDEYKKEYEIRLPEFIEWARSKTIGNPKEIEDIETAIAVEINKKKNLENEFLTLSIFKRARKKEIQNEIAGINNKVTALEKEKKRALSSVPFPNQKPEVIGKDVQTFLVLLAVNGPSRIHSLLKEDEIRIGRKEKAEDLGFWTRLVNLLNKDKMIVIITGYDRYMYFALPDNYLSVVNENFRIEF